MFDDESINLVVKATELNDVSKIYSDFTQSFTVPASRLNNYTFQHYYESDIDGTFNANIRMPALIELGTYTFRQGTIQLENVKLKNKVPEFYKITFYSTVRNLKDKFGDDTLQSLGTIKDTDTPTSLTSLNHTYNWENVVAGLQSGTFLNNDIIYPLVSPKRVWRLGTGVDNRDVNGQIMDITIREGSILYTELKPAVRLIKIIEAIEERYSIFFSRDFFDTANFKDLFMWLSNSSDSMTAFGTPSQTTFSNETYPAPYNRIRRDVVDAYGDSYTYTVTLLATQTNTNYLHYFLVVPNNGYGDIKYKIRMDISIDGGEWNDEVGPIESEVLQGSGENNGVSYRIPRNMTGVDKTYRFRYFIESSGRMIFTSSSNFVPYTPAALALHSRGNNGQESNGNVEVALQMPEIKIIDFISGLFKMFNLIIRPNADGSYRIDTLENYYAGGDTIDISNYVDIDETIIERPELFKSIEYRYEKSEDLLSKQYRDTNGGAKEVGYPDLTANYPISAGEELKITVPFSAIVLERLTNKNEDIPFSNIVIGNAYNSDYSPVNLKGLIFYNNGIIDASSPIIIHKNTINDTSINANYVTVPALVVLSNMALNLVVILSFNATPKSLIFGNGSSKKLLKFSLIAGAASVTALLKSEKTILSAFIDVLNAILKEKEYASEEERLATLKAIADQRVAIEQASADQRLSIQNQYLDSAEQGVGIIKSIFEKNKDVMRASIIAEGAISIARQIINTNAANARATAELGIIPAVPVIAANYVSMGVGIAATTVATAKALSALGKGGGVPSGGGGAKGGAPSFNTVGASLEKSFSTLALFAAPSIEVWFSSFCSLVNAILFTICSERKPSICASTPAASFSALINATLLAMVLFRDRLF